MSGEPWQPTAAHAAHAASEYDDDLDAARGIFGWPLVASVVLVALVAVGVLVLRGQT